MERKKRMNKKVNPLKLNQLVIGQKEVVFIEFF